MQGGPGQPRTPVLGPGLAGCCCRPWRREGDGEGRRGIQERAEGQALGTCMRVEGAGAWAVAGLAKPLASHLRERWLLLVRRPCKPHDETANSSRTADYGRTMVMMTTTEK